MGFSARLMKWCHILTATITGKMHADLNLLQHAILEQVQPQDIVNIFLFVILNFYNLNSSLLVALSFTKRPLACMSNSLQAK